MSIIYSLAAINARLSGVVTTIDAGPGFGVIVLMAASTVISTITLQKPSATVSGGVLTFSGVLGDPSVAGVGVVTTAQVRDSTGTIVISGFTVGIPGSSADIIISNGLNSVALTSGQIVQLLSAQITGS